MIFFKLLLVSLILFLRIRIMHVLRIGNNCVTKDNFPRSVEMDNKGRGKLSLYSFHSN